jgi:IS1 family transposase
MRVGNGCARLLDEKMRDLTCNYLQFDEIWGFIGKKQKHLMVDDDPTKGDVWTFCAIDSETKIVPAYRVGKRNHQTANAFVSDIASRLRNRPQISTDGLRSYIEAVENAFGSEVDYGMAIKNYGADTGEHHQERRYSAPDVVSIERRAVCGRPEMDLISTSHIERLNGTTRLHVKRLARLTYAFSKKLEHFEAAVALHFAYYNFVRTHNTLKMTPAMFAGIEKDFWSVGDLVEATL